MAKSNSGGLFLRKFRTHESADKAMRSYCKAHGWDVDDLKIIKDGALFRVDIRTGHV